MRWGIFVCGVALVAAIVFWGNTIPVASVLHADDNAGVAAEATATREAELEELNALRTQVAELTAGTPDVDTATPVGMPTVPSALAGEVAPHGDEWTIIVQSAMQTGVTEDDRRVIRIDFTVNNLTNESARFRYDRLDLIDDQGRLYRSDFSLSNVYGTPLGIATQPNQSTDFAIAFPVLPDAGNDFILESRDDPDFRVAVSLGLQG